MFESPASHHGICQFCDSLLKYDSPSKSALKAEKGAEMKQWLYETSALGASIFFWESPEGPFQFPALVYQFLLRMISNRRTWIASFHLLRKPCQRLRDLSWTWAARHRACHSPRPIHFDVESKAAYMRNETFCGGRDPERSSLFAPL